MIEITQISLPGFWTTPKTVKTLILRTVMSLLQKSFSWENSKALSLNIFASAKKLIRFVGKLTALAHLGKLHTPLMVMICQQWRSTIAENVLNRLQRVLLRFKKEALKTIYVLVKSPYAGFNKLFYVTMMITVPWVLVSARSSDIPTIVWTKHGLFGNGKAPKNRVVRLVERINLKTMQVFLLVDSTEFSESMWSKLIQTRTLITSLDKGLKLYLTSIKVLQRSLALLLLPQPCS